MSTRIRRFARDHCRPRTLAALIEVAIIGSWRGRCFLDDDAEFADLDGFVPAESAPPAAKISPLGPAGGGTHSVAA